MKKIDEDVLNRVDATLKERYSVRLDKFGDDPKTLGWDNKRHQFMRFKVATDSFDMSNSTILDVGCGLGDFFTHLKQQNINIRRYAGMDINPDLILRCNEISPDADFTVGNLLTQSPKDESFDVVCLFGVLNFKFSEFDNMTFTKNIISQAFKVCKKAVVVDMLSVFYDKNYGVEDFVYYYNPVDMLDFALGLSPHVKICHNYKSIPQREFLLIIEKSV